MRNLFIYNLLVLYKIYKKRKNILFALLLDFFGKYVKIVSRAFQMGFGTSEYRKPFGSL